MNDSHISVRYAKALFKSALDKNQIDRVYKDMAVITELCGVKDFMHVIETPSINSRQKKEVTLGILKGKISELTNALINLVLENKRESYLPAIARNYAAIYKLHKGIKSASLITASAIDESTVGKLKDMVEKAMKSEVELSTTVDDSILGGFVLTVEDQQYDASISSGLKKIKKQLLESTVTKN